MFDKLIKKLDIIEPLVDRLNDKALTTKYTFLCDRIGNPDFFAVFLGETSSGKSTIINGLMSENILPVGAAPTTGVITEVNLNCNNNKFYALDEDAVMTELGREDFRNQCFHPAKNLARLVVHRNIANHDLRGVRVFDTPGYGAIVKEHEEVLKQFLPNSDIVIYTIDYRRGIQEYDFVFLKSIKALLRDEDIPIVVVINMCPENMAQDDRRVREIARYAKDIIGKTPQIFTIKRIVRERTSTAPVLPDCTDLWKYISSVVHSRKRQSELYDAFDGFISDFYEECRNLAELRYNKSKLQYNELQEMVESQKEYADGIMKAVDIIRPTFARIRKNLDSKFSDVVSSVQEEIDKQIDDEKKGNVDEMIAFTNGHLLPFSVTKYSKEYVNFYIETELNDLNEQVNNLINDETKKFQTQLSVNPNSPVAQFAERIVKNLVQRFAEKGLTAYFAAYGGAAGAGAGVANAASHLLKKIGDLVGKTFSKEIHNGLKQFLAKIGFTSTKSIGAAITVLIEGLVYLIKINTWKGPLKGKVSDALSEWKKETLPPVLEDLDKLEAQNIDEITTIAQEIMADIEVPDYKNTDDLFKDVELAYEIGNKLNNA